MPLVGGDFDLDWRLGAPDRAGAKEALAEAAGFARMGLNFCEVLYEQA